MNSTRMYWFLILLICLSIKSSLAQRFYHEDHEKLLEWEPPKDLQKEYVYYLSGFDKEGGPVWVCEFGNFDIAKKVSEGGNALNIFTKYIQQLIIRMASPPDLSKIPENRRPKRLNKMLIIILDFESKVFSRALFDPPTHAYIVRLLSLMTQMDQSQYPLRKMIFLHMDMVIASLVSHMRFYWASAFHRFKVCGSNSTQWIPELAKYIDKNQLPEWYGGNAGFTPIAIYG